MKIDITPNGDSDALDNVSAAALQAEEGGADGIAYPERSSDAMQHVTLAASATSQVRAHVERRSSMPWGAPRARMTDFVGALRAMAPVSRCWTPTGWGDLGDHLHRLSTSSGAGKWAERLEFVGLIMDAVARESPRPPVGTAR